MKLIYNILLSLLPLKYFLKIKANFNLIKKKFQQEISIDDLKQLFENKFDLQKGDTIFVHSSIRNLKVNFPFENIYFLLKEIIGSEGTLLFPCWHIDERAEDYLNKTSKPFNVRKSRSKLGFLSEYVRLQKDAIRSLHPTNSVVGVGKNAAPLLNDHHLDIYPCGEKSPFYKMMEHKAKIIGIGVDVVNLSFLHCIEDIMKERFPIKTRKDKIYSCNVLNVNGESQKVETLVAHPNIVSRDIVGFIEKNIPNNACLRLKYKGNLFFSTKSNELFTLVSTLAEKGLTIYK